MLRRFLSRSPEDTLALGHALGNSALPGLVVAARGDLGAGKTVLAKGVARGLGVPGWRYVTSPTFTIHNRYEGRLRFDHLDLYRLEDPEELEALGLEDELGQGDVCVIEWPDLFAEVLPPDRIDLTIGPGEGDGRVITLEASGTVAGAVLGETARALPELLERETRA